MTTVNPNTFDGPNNGVPGGYVPGTLIESAKIDADLESVETDLDYHLSTLQNIYTKLDTIEVGASATQDASAIVALINASGELIDLDNLDADVASDSEVSSAISTHMVTTVPGEMHTEESIKNTGLSYSNTPTSVDTTPDNLLDEMKNIRWQMDRVVGKGTWIDIPDNSLAEVKVALDKIEEYATADQSNAEIRAAVDAAIDSNVFTDSEKTKLSSVETSATADLTGSEIKSLYEAEAQTNAFTDSEKSKLTNIESNATQDQNATEIVNLINVSSEIINDARIAATITRDSELATALELNIGTVTTDYTIPLSDYTILADASSNTITTTLPTANGNAGKIYNIKKTDSSNNVVTIDGNSTDTIDGDETYEISIQYESITVQSTGTEWVII